MKLMIEIEDRDEALEAQEELIRLEQEKTVGLEESLSKQRKSFKVQEDLLNGEIGKLFELEKSFTKEKEKVVKLTKELSLANESNASIKSTNETLQEKLSCSHADYKDLEGKYTALKEGTLDSHDATKSSNSIPSIVIGVAILIFNLVPLTLRRCTS